MATLEIYKLTSLPPSNQLRADAFYYIENGNYAEAYLTDAAKVLKNVGNSSMIQEVVTLMGLTAGRSVELQKTGTAIQWRRVGDATWINLVLLVDLKGDPGTPGPPGAPGSPGAPGAPGDGAAASEAVSIKSLGVFGTGSNEHDALEAAFAAGAGKEILIENMTIRTSAFTIPGNNTKISMRNSVIKYIASGAQPLNFCYITGNNKDFQGMEFDMEGLAGGPTSGTTVMYFDGCEDVVIHKCKIHDNGHAAIKCVGGTNFTITNNKIWNTDAGIYALANLEGGVQNLNIADNTIYNGTSEGIAIFSHGDAALISQYAIVTNNHVYGKPSAAFNFSRTVNLIFQDNQINDCSAGAWFQDTGSGFAYNEFSAKIQIQNNRFFNVEYGLTHVADGCLVSGNSFTHVGRTAIGTNGNMDADGNPTVLAYGIHISDNQFIDCSWLDQSWPVIELQQLRDVIVRGNTFTKSVNTDVKCIRFQDCTGIIEKNYAPDSKFEQFSTDVTHYGNRLMIKDNTFLDVNMAPSYPIAGGVYNWHFDQNNYINFDLDYTNFSFDLAPDSGALNAIHERFVREFYRVASGSNITSIAASWLYRRITLISKGETTIIRGGNIALAASFYSLDDGTSITLRWDGFYWRELYHSLATP